MTCPECGETDTPGFGLTRPGWTQRCTLPRPFTWKPNESGCASSAGVSMRDAVWLTQTSSSSVGHASAMAGSRARKPAERTGLVAAMYATRPTARIPAPVIHTARVASASCRTGGRDDRGEQDDRGDGCVPWIRLRIDLPDAGPLPSGVAGKTSLSDSGGRDGRKECAVPARWDI